MSWRDKRVHCQTHGEAAPAFVCTHIVQTLLDAAPRGFISALTEDGCINAWCADCDRELQRAGGRWNDASEAFAKVTLVCERCAERAAEINGVREHQH